MGSSADYAAYAAVSRSGIDPNTVPIGGGTADRMAVLASGTVDATVVTSPAEYGLRTR